jgi:hypothetical protein
MDIGMLWFDNDPKTQLEAKIARAAGYYRDKYGKTPTLCFIHPSMIPGEQSDLPPTEPAQPRRAGNIEVRTSGAVMPFHFWIGVNGVNGAATVEA